MTVRRRILRPRRATVVFVEAVVGVAAAAIAAQSLGGYVAAGAAAAVGVAGLARRHGRGIADAARDRLRDPDGPPAAPSGGDDPAGPGRDLGVATVLLPGLHVTEVPTRDGALGIAGDGQGFAVVLSADITAPRTWAFADLVDVLAADPARPAAVQLLIEQRGAGRAVADPDFAPSRAYRSLPVRGLPLWNRVLVAVRHEPAWAPETVAARGGGATGARTALAAVAARTRARADRDGVRLRPVGGDELAVLLRDLGDPGPADGPDPDGWTTSAGRHVALSVPLEADGSVGALLRATAELDVDRCVLSVTANAIDHSVCAVVRLVAADPALAERAAAQLVADGLADPLPDAQDAGFVATLPLGGGARSLADLVSQVRS